MGDLSAVKAATKKKAAACEKYEAADEALREAIREALNAGASAMELTEVTGLSRARIYQIKDNRR
jgi:D-aminopeptidase